MTETPSAPGIPGDDAHVNRQPEADANTQTGIPTSGSPQTGDTAAVTDVSQTQTQPTVPEPYVASSAPAQQVPYGAPQYGQGSFGQPYSEGQPPYPSAPLDAATAEQSAPTVTKKRPKTGLIIASLAVVAVLGGVAGAGAGVGIYSASGSHLAFKTVAGPQNITVNNTQNATTVTAVAAKAMPSVVTISVSSSDESGTGSGIVLSSDGYVLTNTHVVTLDGESSSVKITVTDNNGKIYQATVVGTDPITDLAVIKLTGASGMIPMTWGDSSKINVGDTTVAIGAPLGLSGTVTDGIVSALNRSISIASSAVPKSTDSDNGNSNSNPFNFDFPGQGNQSQESTTRGTIELPVIQTDAAINPGNSGGALLDSTGELIGVNVAIASTSSSSSSDSQSGSIGVGFAIPSNLAKRIAEEIITNGSATHGLLGASISDAANQNNASTVGALVQSVTSGGAAATGGIQAGDVIVNFNNVPITDSTDLMAQVRSMAPGTQAAVTYIRNGQIETTNVTLGSLPASAN